MQKTISRSCYDAIIIKQENRTYRSTPFQVVFSSSLIKLIQKNKQKGVKPYELTLQINDRKVDIPIRIDSTGRVVFQKRYNRKHSMVSDSSDVSDQQYSQKSSTIDSRISTSKQKEDKLEQFKNEKAPNRFWQFAWLFNKKKQDEPKINKIQQEQQIEKINLGKIKEQVYEGEQNCFQPLFHLSLCGNLLKKKQTQEEILKIFYQNRLDYSTFIKDPPTYMNNDNLVMKLDGSIYTWQLGITILTCRYAFGRQLSNQEIEDIIRNKFTKNKFLSLISGSSITKLDIRDYEKPENSSHHLRRVHRQNRPLVKYRKNPDSDKIRKMKLKYGKNVAKFVLDVGLEAKEQIEMKIFLWDRHQKIVISDIDGTITKSDILGQILSKWIHIGITKLFTEVAKRHYKIIYLTARAIGQYQQTSKFLSTVQQQGIYLPQGPLMMSPDGYYRSFTREVIYKTPDYLKAKILASLNEVFPNHKTPIYCGFGNRETDSYAYLRINISPQRIFNITQKSILTRQSDPQFASTYLDLLENIDEYFPQFIKDNPMIESSSESEISEFEAVGLDDSSYMKNTKSKSVEADVSQINFQGIQANQLALIGSQSKKRNSEHDICDVEEREFEILQSNNTEGNNSLKNSKTDKQQNENYEKQKASLLSASEQLKKFALNFELNPNKKNKQKEKQKQEDQICQSPQKSSSKNSENDSKSSENCKQGTEEVPQKQLIQQQSKCKQKDKNSQEPEISKKGEEKLLQIQQKLQEGKSQAQIQRNQTKQQSIENKELEQQKPIDDILPQKVL